MMKIYRAFDYLLMVEKINKKIKKNETLIEHFN